MKLIDIKGIGPAREKLLNNLNIYTEQDLLSHYPYRYNVINLKNELNSTEKIYIKCNVASAPVASYIRRNFNILKFKAIFNNQIINVIIYNRAFLKPNLPVNKEITLFGKYDQIKNVFTADNVIFNTKINIEPIYRKTKGINNSFLIKVINEVINESVIEYIPNELNKKYNFLEKDLAVKYIHQPNNINEIKQARLKLIYEEFFIYLLRLLNLKESNKKLLGIKREINLNDLENFVKNLKFVPTKDQFNTFKDILNDMLDEKRMNRLVMGDVGSGKTLTAIYAIYINYLSNYQSAFMVPTEILAKQHYETLKEMLPELRVKLLTGKMKQKEINEVKELIKCNKIDLVIGTHSLINVEFYNLGLIITDEQHRFGVKQREKIEEKINNPDILYLSATPIPRTYALVLYNDMNLSIIKEKPKGRLDVETKVIKEKNIKEVLYHIKSELTNNNQIFIVSPLIDNEESNLESVIDLKKKYEKAFPKEMIEIIHGEMKSEEKDDIMTRFSEKQFKILISTTVIEVGIDIKDATMMIIYNAERFGLATLHQLRGRVGRSEKQSYCYLISDYDNERLIAMEESNDGFYITEMDYKNRKEGDLFGERQSGELSFKLADIKRDYKILLQVNNDMDNKYLNDPKYKNIIDY